MENREKYIEIIKRDKKVFLQFLKAKFPFFHNSNFFFRDLQYGIQMYFGSKGIKITLAVSEELAIEVGKYLEVENIFVTVNQHGWRINYPEFVTTVSGDPF